MISKKTLEYWAYPIMMGIKLRCIPFIWNWKKVHGDYMELADDNKWFLVAHINIVLRVTVICFLIFVTTLGRFDAGANILSLFFVSIYSFSLIMQLILLKHYKIIHAFTNKMLRLNHRLMRFHGLPKDSPDGLESVARIMKTAIIIALCSNFPGGVVLLQKGFGVFGKLRSPYLPVNVLTALIWTYLQATDWNITLFYSYLTVIYVNYAHQWVGSLKWRANLTAATKSKFRLFYRAHQILHSTALEFLDKLMLLHVSAGGILMITSFYSVIKFPSNSSNLPVLIRIGLTGIVAVIQFTIYQSRARDTRENSVLYPLSYLKHQDRVHKYELKFFKSCRPIKFQTGPSLAYCRRDFFLLFMEGIVIRNTINLLLTFKQTISVGLISKLLD